MCVLGRYVATELWLELGRRVRARLLRSDRARLVCGPIAILELVRGRFGYVYVALGQSVFGSIEIRKNFTARLFVKIFFTKNHFRRKCLC